jgi:hypothetical protein
MSASNQPYDYDVLMAKRKQRFIEVISQVSSIIFYDFIEFDKEVMQAFSRAEPQTSTAARDQCDFVFQFVHGDLSMLGIHLYNESQMQKGTQARPTKRIIREINR